MKLTAKQLSQILHGTVDGDPQATVTSFAKIEHGKKGSISFFANPKYEKYVYTSNASVLLVNEDFKPKHPVNPTMIRVPNAYAAVAELLNYVARERSQHRFHRGFSLIAWSARLGKSVYVGSFCTIGAHSRIGNRTVIKNNVTVGEGVKIGDNCLLYPGVRIYPGTIIGDNVIIHENAVIGSDGFGNVPQPDGTWQKIEHLGNVVIHDDVEIGANTTIDRAQMESTIIGKGVRIDNLCMIAHNVEIGDNTVMAAQTGIAGSTKVGKNCIFAGQVGISGHLVVADNTTLCAQAGLCGNVKETGKVFMGSPAISHISYLKSYAKFKQND